MRLWFTGSRLITGGRLSFSIWILTTLRWRSTSSSLVFRYQPHLILLDGEGNVVQEYVGAQPEEDLRVALDSLLGQ